MPQWGTSGVMAMKLGWMTTVRVLSIPEQDKTQKDSGQLLHWAPAPVRDVCYLFV